MEIVNVFAGIVVGNTTDQTVCERERTNNIASESLCTRFVYMCFMELLEGVDERRLIFKWKTLKELAQVIQGLPIILANTSKVFELKISRLLFRRSPMMCSS